MNWYIASLKKFADFSGRARRTEYWMFVLFNLLIGIALALVDKTIGTSNAATGVGLLGGIFSLAVLLPGLAVSVRRLHDTGRSGWWLLLALIPLIGVIVLVVFMLQGGTPGQNQHGTNPKEAHDWQ